MVSSSGMLDPKLRRLFFTRYLTPSWDEPAGRSFVVGQEPQGPGGPRVRATLRVPMSWLKRRAPAACLAVRRRGGVGQGGRALAPSSPVGTCSWGEVEL